jgi:hypothetical protein
MKVLPVPAAAALTRPNILTRCLSNYCESERQDRSS